MRILCIEDDTLVIPPLLLALKRAHYAVDHARCGDTAIFLTTIYPYDAIVLGSDIAKMSAQRLIQSWREKGVRTPILVIGKSTQVTDITSFLDIGADDYLSKPFAMAELLARLRALTRRPLPLMNEADSIGDLSINYRQYEVRRRGKKIRLTKKEFMLLQYMMRYKGSILSRNEIMEHVWDRHADPFSNTIEAHILSLRKKIEGPRMRKLIHTISGVGYKIDIHP